MINIQVRETTLRIDDFPSSMAREGIIEFEESILHYAAVRYELRRFPAHCRVVVYREKLTRVSFPDMVFLVMWEMKSGQFREMRIYATPCDGVLDVARPMTGLFLEGHVTLNNGVCLGTALRHVSEGMDPVDAFWNSGFEYVRFYPSERETPPLSDVVGSMVYSIPSRPGPRPWERLMVAAMTVAWHLLLIMALSSLLGLSLGLHIPRMMLMSCLLFGVAHVASFVLTIAGITNTQRGIDPRWRMRFWGYVLLLVLGGLGLVIFSREREAGLVSRRLSRRLCIRVVRLSDGTGVRLVPSYERERRRDA